MIRQASIILIICYLSLTATLANSHNHSISEGENDNCPAYIISHSFNCDNAFNNTILIQYVPEQIEYLKILKDIFPKHIKYLSINNRAPPIPN
jgi:hypothetical protein